MVHKQGKLFYLMGASGSGKDTLLRSVRQRLPSEAPVRFATRYITRPEEQEGENHIALTETEFERLLRDGCFAMNWTSHGLQYGIGTEINRWLENGLNVVVNGSREYFSEAERTNPNIIPIMICVSDRLLRQRLLQRGRESAEAIEERLARAHAFGGLVKHPRLITIDNSGPLEEACEKLVSIFTSKSTLLNLSTSLNHNPGSCV
jgi:ribose 1,5-bisphosphokinase